MFRRFSTFLYTKTLSNGTKLQGKMNPAKPEYLLEGIVELPDGRVFSGHYHPIEGYPLPGSKLEEDGDLYKGSFNSQWQREGPGESWLIDGTYYIGEFKSDDLIQGTVRIPNGASEMIFEGTLKDEMFLSGTLRENDFVYYGEFKENKPHGKGKLIFSTGAEQEGTFYYGKLHGSDCKMKLEGGVVYVGEFNEGIIKRGTLYTTTYTYEGEFNENGRAHGEGLQTYLINEPRLTFTGIWNNGALVRGVCTDEFGAPIDWQNDYSLQSKILSASPEDNSAVEVNAYCGAKLKEADQLYKGMNKSYQKDAACVAQTTGKYPSKIDLGYERGIRVENEAVQESAKQQMENLGKCRSEISAKKETFRDVMQNLGGITSTLNENTAQMNFAKQTGAQQLSSERVDEQFERFMKSFDRPSSCNADDGKKLAIDGNAPWKTFVSKD